MFPERRATLSSEEVLGLRNEQRTAMPDAPDELLQFGVALEVAMILLGERVFFAVFGTDDPHFGSFDGSGATGDCVYRQRVITFGKHLFECQRVENFEAMREDMISRTFAGVAHELRCAAMALRAGFSVRAVERTGVRGRDFDFLIDNCVALETKAKDDDTLYSRSTLISTLKSARKQLPAEGPGVVMLAVPDSWRTDHRLQVDIDGVVGELFRNSERVNAVFVMWDKWVPMQPQGMACIRRFRRFEHSNPRAASGEVVVAGLLVALQPTAD